MPDQNLPSTIQNRNLIESILYLKQNNLLPESKSTIKFETTKEAEDSKKEEVLDVIKEKINITKQDITDLQKAGYNLHLETIKLIVIPLKIKIWLSTLTKKDLENIFKILQIVDTTIAPLKKENEEKIAEKERLEKEKSQKEKQNTQVAQKPTGTKSENNIPPKPILKKPQPTQSPKTNP